jgi:hypothetical protein
MENCLKCGAPLEASNGKGRPKAYCSTACRRAAEMEIKRADQRLGALENDAQNYRLGRMMDLSGSDAKQVDAEIKRLEARLKLLLSGDADG